MSAAVSLAPNVPAYPVQGQTLQWTDAAGVLNLLQFSSVLEEDWDEGTTITEHPVEVGPDVADHIKSNLPKCSLKIKSTNEPIGVAPTMGAPNPDTATVGPLSLPQPSCLWTRSPPGVEYPTWYNPITLRALLQLGAGQVGGAIGSAAGGSGAAGLAGGAIGAGLGSLAGALLLAAREEEEIAITDAGLLPVLNPGIIATTQQWLKGTDYVYQMHALLVALKSAGTLFTVNGSKQTEPNMAIEELTFHRAGETGTGEDITLGLKQLNIVSTQVVAAPIPNLSGGGGVPSTPQGQQTPTPSAPPRASVAANLLNKLLAPPAVPGVP